MVEAKEPPVSSACLMFPAISDRLTVGPAWYGQYTALKRVEAGFSHAYDDP